MPRCGDLLISTIAWIYKESEWGHGINDVIRSRSASVFLNSCLDIMGYSLILVDMEGNTWRKIPRPHGTLPLWGIYPPVRTRQDMGRTIKGGLAHKIKACTARLQEDVIYCIIPNRIFFVTLPLQSI